MFDEKTVMILGAGASFDYNYPTGKDLITKIIDSIRHDAVYIPHSLGNSSTEFNISDFKGFPTYEPGNEPSLDILLKNIYQEPSKTPITFSGHHVTYGANPIYIIFSNSYALSKIPELKALYDDLIAFNPISIDKFLKEHPKHQEAGKIMIAYVLLKCEIKVDIPSDLTKLEGWYRLLLHKLTSNCKPDELHKNKLDIFTFNYDPSLDYYLKTSLIQNPYFSENVQDYFKHENYPLKKENHLYGYLYNETDLEPYSLKKKLDGKYNDEKIINYFYMFQATKMSDALLTIDEAKQKQVANNINTMKITKKINQAQRIIIIGFGFDESNQELLDLGNILRDSNSISEICWHNYKGGYKALEDDLRSITGKKLRCSHADNICDAWSNDFMTRLKLT